MGRDTSLDVAVVGVAARLPGPGNLLDWWDGIVAGRSFFDAFSRDELITAGVPAQYVDDQDYVPVHGRLSGADAFDNAFFGISPREAERMDPQHRLALEVAWQALEDAGVRPNDADGRTGVFASSTGSGYLRWILARQQPDPATLDDLVHGTEPDFLASRISYKLGLTGPAMAVQTACSSSLVALHLAVQALINGDCDQALVVATGMSYPQGGYLHLPGGVLSPTGRCRPFDSSADGVVGGSGAACVVLRRLDDLSAEDGTPRGVILGTAINNDGADKAGYYAPSAVGQERAIRDALRAADIDASTIGYLETHGTGTPIGDPVEWHAASSALLAENAAPEQIALGALKANVGHLDACAGLAALVKTLFVLESGTVPPVVGFSELNPLMAGSKTPLFVPDRAMPWSGPEPRRAGISAFGIGGTNAHVVVEAATRNQPAEAAAGSSATGTESAHIVVLSAADDSALARRAGALADHLESSQLSLASVSHTLVRGRAELSHRLAFAARSSSEAADRLRRPEECPRGETPDSGPAPLIFVFPGQGTQAPGMAGPYRRALPGFGDALDACLDAVPAPLRGRLRTALDSPEFPAEDLDQTELAQPAIVCLQIATVTALEALGIRPTAVIGHSLGELAAAAAAGVLDVGDAVGFAVERGRSMQACPPGSMLAVACSEADARELMAGTSLDLASINGLDACVIAGRTEEIAQLEDRIGPGVFHRRLRTTRAFHSSLMADAVPRLRAAADAMTMRPATRVFASASDATLHAVGDTPDPARWGEAARLPVRFAATLEQLTARLPGSTALEIGPGRALAPLLEASGLPAVTVGSRSARTSELDLLGGLAELWTAGHHVALARLTPVGRTVRLPVYPFAGPRHLPSIPADTAPRSTASAATEPLATGPPAIDLVVADGPRPVLAEADLAEVVKSAWREFLGRDDVTESSDFFDFGGDSLLITRMTRALNRELDIRIPVRELLGSRTVGGHIKVASAAVRDSAK